MWSFFNTVKNIIHSDEITVQYAINNGFGSNGSMTCSPDNIKSVYEHIERVVAFRLKYADLHQVSIDMNGKLKGCVLNKHFDSLTEFKEFLEFQKLIAEPTKLTL